MYPELVRILFVSRYDVKTFPSLGRLDSRVVQCSALNIGMLCPGLWVRDTVMAILNQT